MRMSVCVGDDGLGCFVGGGWLGVRGVQPTPQHDGGPPPLGSPRQAGTTEGWAGTTLPFGYAQDKL